MGKGRKKTPTPIKAARDTLRKDRTNPAEPKPQVKVPPCPKFLPPAAKKEWRRAGKLLAQHGLISDIDKAAFMSYCLAVAELEMATEKLKKENAHVVRSGVFKKTTTKQNGTVVVEESMGVVKKNPYISIRDNAMDKIRQFCAEFGMTPASRSKVDASAAPQNDPWKEWMNRKSNRNRTGTNGPGIA